MLLIGLRACQSRQRGRLFDLAKMTEITRLPGNARAAQCRNRRRP
jgi:hypothetical protein